MKLKKIVSVLHGSTALILGKDNLLIKIHPGWRSARPRHSVCIWPNGDEIWFDNVTRQYRRGIAPPTIH